MRWVPSVAEASAVLVTFLWSTSFILIKVGLHHMPPLDFAAYRYGLAAVVLISLSAVTKPANRGQRLNRRDVIWVVALGVSGYTLAQGLQFVGLDYLTTVTTSFLQNTTPIFVLCIGYPLLREVPVRLQYGGLTVAMAGVALFFLGQPLKAEAAGVTVVLLSSLSWAVYLVIVKRTQVVERLGTLRFTALTMGVGSAAMFMGAVPEGVSLPFGVENWAIIAWLALVNTAFAFYLWNLALKRLKAFELSLLQNTMLVQIAILSWYFLGVAITVPMALGMALILVGIGLVQVPALAPGRFGNGQGGAVQH